jgi:hypothetical protein
VLQARGGCTAVIAGPVTILRLQVAVEVHAFDGGLRRLQRQLIIGFHRHIRHSFHLLFWERVVGAGVRAESKERLHRTCCLATLARGTLCRPSSDTRRQRVSGKGGRRPKRTFSYRIHFLVERQVSGGVRLLAFHVLPHLLAAVTHCKHLHQLPAACKGRAQRANTESPHAGPAMKGWKQRSREQ